MVCMCLLMPNLMWNMPSHLDTYMLTQNYILTYIATMHTSQQTGNRHTICSRLCVPRSSTAHGHSLRVIP